MELSVSTRIGSLGDSGYSELTANTRSRSRVLATFSRNAEQKPLMGAGGSASVESIFRSKDYVNSYALCLYPFGLDRHYVELASRNKRLSKNLLTDGFLDIAPVCTAICLMISFYKQIACRIELLQNFKPSQDWPSGRLTRKIIHSTLKKVCPFIPSVCSPRWPFFNTAIITEKVFPESTVLRLRHHLSPCVASNSPNSMLNAAT